MVVAQVWQQSKTRFTPRWYWNRNGQRYEPAEVGRCSASACCAAACYSFEDWSDEMGELLDHPRRQTYLLDVCWFEMLGEGICDSCRDGVLSGPNETVAFGCGRDQDTASVVRVGGAVQKAACFEGSHGRSHGLRSHSFTSRQVDDRLRPISVKPGQHDSLRRRNAVLQFISHPSMKDAYSHSDCIGCGEEIIALGHGRNGPLHFVVFVGIT